MRVKSVLVLNINFYQITRNPGIRVRKTIKLSQFKYKYKKGIRKEVILITWHLGRLGFKVRGIRTNLSSTSYVTSGKYLTSLKLCFWTHNKYLYLSSWACTDKYTQSLVYLWSRVSSIDGKPSTLQDNDIIIIINYHEIKGFLSIFSHSQISAVPNTEQAFNKH